MLGVSDLHYRYGAVPVLSGVDITVGAGEVVSLVGPNGAGKSTLLKCINGVLAPERGAITIDGRPAPTYSRRELARTVASVPQQQGSSMALTVVEMIALGRAPHRGLGTAKHDREVVMDVVERLGLEPLAFRPCGTLSGGERQRVLLARALAQQGRLLLLDEPTTALDLRHQLETMAAVRAIVREGGLSALIAIHDLALASRFSDRLVLLSKGQVRTEGGWRDVLAAAHVEAAYGVSAIIGADHDLPYVIPIAAGLSSPPSSEDDR